MEVNEKMQQSDHNWIKLINLSLKEGLVPDNWKKVLLS